MAVLRRASQRRAGAFIAYVRDDEIPDRDRVPDRDNIVRVHGAHPRTMRQHYELYLEERFRR